MKHLLLFLGLGVIALTSCKKTQVDDNQDQRIGFPTNIIPEYNITLERITNLNNQTTVLWKIVNPKPSTTPDLKGWSLVLSDETIGNNIIEAYHGTDPKNLSQSPASYKAVPGSCYTGKALSFNFGTNGGTPSYYLVVFKGNYGQGISFAVTESTVKDDCTKRKIPGIGDF